MPASAESTCAQLIHDAQADVPEAWQKLYHVYSPLVRRWCVKFGLNEVDAADITQEVFLRLMRYLKDYEYDKERAKFRTWIYVVTMNCVRDFSRARKDTAVAEGGTNAHNTLLDIEQGDPPSDDAESDRDQAFITQRVLSLIQTDFSETTWNAFLRSTVNGEGTASIAADLKLSVGAVRQAKSRVLRRLREELSELA